MRIPLKFGNETVQDNSIPSLRQIWNFSTYLNLQFLSRTGLCQRKLALIIIAEVYFIQSQVTFTYYCFNRLFYDFKILSLKYDKLSHHIGIRILCS